MEGACAIDLTFEQNTPSRQRRQIFKSSINTVVLIGWIGLWDVEKYEYSFWSQTEINIIKYGSANSQNTLIFA